MRKSHPPPPSPPSAVLYKCPSCPASISKTFIKEVDYRRHFSLAHRGSLFTEAQQVFLKDSQQPTMPTTPTNTTTLSTPQQEQDKQSSSKSTIRTFKEKNQQFASINFNAFVKVNEAEFKEHCKKIQKTAHTATTSSNNSDRDRDRDDYGAPGPKPSPSPKPRSHKPTPKLNAVTGTSSRTVHSFLKSVRTLKTVGEWFSQNSAKVIEERRSANSNSTSSTAAPAPVNEPSSPSPPSPPQDNEDSLLSLSPPASPAEPPSEPTQASQPAGEKSGYWADPQTILSNPSLPVIGGSLTNPTSTPSARKLQQQAAGFKALRQKAHLAVKGRNKKKLASPIKKAPQMSKVTKLVKNLKASGYTNAQNRPGPGDFDPIAAVTPLGGRSLVTKQPIRRGVKHIPIPILGKTPEGRLRTHAGLITPPPIYVNNGNSQVQTHIDEDDEEEVFDPTMFLEVGTALPKPSPVTRPTPMPASVQRRKTNKPSVSKPKSPSAGSGSGFPAGIKIVDLSQIIGQGQSTEDSNSATDANANHINGNGYQPMKEEDEEDDDCPIKIRSIESLAEPFSQSQSNTNAGASANSAAAGQEDDDEIEIVDFRNYANNSSGGVGGPSRTVHHLPAQVAQPQPKCKQTEEQRRALFEKKKIPALEQGSRQYTPILKYGEYTATGVTITPTGPAAVTADFHSNAPAPSMVSRPRPALTSSTWISLQNATRAPTPPTPKPTYRPNPNPPPPIRTNIIGRAYLPPTTANQLVQHFPSLRASAPTTSVGQQGPRSHLSTAGSAAATTVSPSSY